MKISTYVRESARTASSQFHDEIVDSSMLDHVLTQAVATGELVDVAKKSLFYGKAIKTGTDIEQFQGKDTDLNMDAVSHDILHASLGLFTESAEMLEAVLSAMKSGKPLDEVNMFEELGDSLWYMAMMCRDLKRDPEEAMQLNIDKLRLRFPDKFTTDAAVNRDVNSERKLLEEGFEA